MYYARFSAEKSKTWHGLGQTCLYKRDSDKVKNKIKEASFISSHVIPYPPIAQIPGNLLIAGISTEKNKK